MKIIAIRFDTPPPYKYKLLQNHFIHSLTAYLCLCLFIYYHMMQDNVQVLGVFSVVIWYSFIYYIYFAFIYVMFECFK